MSWNTTYRPKSVTELHLESVRKQLQSMLAAGKISQALLFAGPKGTGKTSTARIVGALLNDPKNTAVVTEVYLNGKKSSNPLLEPDSESSFSKSVFSGNSFVVQELDAASNRGIDDIRQLKSRVYLPPQEGLMSVFILDEAHMLTTEAFNALLKLLEEPPSHAIFILATTELHKIPETIVSRCQVIQFQKASSQEIVAALSNILNKESITYDESGLKIVATYADGSFRDAVKTAESIAQSGSVTKETVEHHLHQNTGIDPAEVIGYVLRKDEPAIISFFELARKQGVDSQYLYTQVIKYLHNSLIHLVRGVAIEDNLLSQAAAQFLLTQLNSAELNLPSVIEHLPLELKLLEVIQKSKQKNSGNPPPSTSPSPTPVKKLAKSQVETRQTTSKTTKVTEPVIKNLDLINDTTAAPQAKSLLERWPAFLELLLKSNPTLASILNSAKVAEYDAHTIAITVFYTFHKEQLLQVKSIATLDATARALTGESMRFHCELAKESDAEHYSAHDLAAAAIKVLA